MKRTLLLFSQSVIILMVLSILPSNGQMILYEGFDYTLPGNVGGNGNAGSSSNNWTTHSVTSGQTTTIDLTATSLTYTGLMAPTGSKCYLFSNANTISRDINRDITTTASVIYFSALINIVDNSQITTTGDYFFHLGATAGSAITIFGARVGVKSVNSGSNYRFILLNTSGGTTTYTEFPQDMNFGTTYLVVSKYDRSAAPTIATLWVNPIPLGGTEPGNSITNSSGTGTFSTFASICLRNSSTTPKAEIDEIRVGTTFADVTPASSHTTPPVATFYPTNSATDVLTNVKPVITYDEPVRKYDGSPLENSDLATLITFKKSDAAGADVPFSATIDAGKKVITITPSSALDNSQLYYLAVAKVEDESGNENTPSNSSFTTIAASSPTITLTWPVGGETTYSTDVYPITWTSANITTVKIEVYAPDAYTREWSWMPAAPDQPASAGKYDITVPASAPYGTQYKIRVSDLSNAAVNSASGNFTVIMNATSITDIRTRCIKDDIVRLKGEVVMSFKRATGNQKYVQDAGKGIIIYDPAAVLTTPLSIGDKFTGLEGKIDFYGGMMELIPTKASVTVTSSGNEIPAPEITVTEYNTNYLNYEAMLIKLTDVLFTAGDGSAVFASNANTPITDGTTTITFRTFVTGESNIVGSVIPIQHVKVTAIAGFFNTTVQVLSRTLADFEILLDVEDPLLRNQLKIYPVPATSILNVENSGNVKSIEILDAGGKVIRTFTYPSEEIVSIPVSYLKRGIYLIRLNTAEGKVIRRFIKL